MGYLENIHCREDLNKLSWEEDAQLCAEIRQFLIEHVSQTGGHLASNLGVVELTVAIQKVFDTSQDRLVFDVGHQSYVHKMLTGRCEMFSTLRSFGGMAGFPKPSESAHDAFIAGHASGAVSAAIGMARAARLQGARYSTIALLGDGALTGGLAFEGLSDAGSSEEPIIVILNDNAMSIAQNVGGISNLLARLRLKPSYFGFKKAFHSATAVLPGGKRVDHLVHSVKEWIKTLLLGRTVFEEMGFVYLGPADGHDVKQLTYLLREAKRLQKPVLIHVITQKGRGYLPAEKNPDQFHGVGPFDPRTGALRSLSAESFSDRFGQTLCALAAKDPGICAVTAAMEQGTGLSGFARQYPERFFDVGIAEEHAVLMAAGLAKQGMRPVVAIYSTFLQRAYDMLVQEVALQRLHIVLAVDRAGLVGEDGETHHGVFDVGFLRQIAGITIYCPANFAELGAMMEAALYAVDGPVAIRYPRGTEGAYRTVSTKTVLQQGQDLTIVTYGTMIEPVLACAARLEQLHHTAEVLKLPTIAPLDLDSVCRSVEKTGRLMVVEETAAAGCIGTELAAELQKRGIAARVCLKNLGTGIVTHGKVDLLLASLGLDAPALTEAALEVLADARQTAYRSVSL